MNSTVPSARVAQANQKNNARQTQPKPREMELTLQSCEEALQRVDPADRATRVRIGEALRDEFGDEAFGVFDAWYSRHSRYTPAESKQAWRSFGKGDGKPCTIGTLIWEAKRGGFKFGKEHQVKRTPQERAQFEAEREARRAQLEVEAAAEQAEAAAHAREIWDAADVDPDGHGYPVRKGVSTLAGVRRARKWVRGWVDPATGEVSIRSYADPLLIPIWSAPGKLASLQAIFPSKCIGRGENARDKDYLKNGRKLGCYFLFGRITKDATLAIFCEGWATGASLHEATGLPVVVCFDAGNLEPVAAMMHSKLPALRMVFAADNDQFHPPEKGNPGVMAATKAAKAVGGIVAVPQFEDLTTQPKDFNDLQQLEGAEAVKKLIDEALAETSRVLPVVFVPACSDAELADIQFALDALAVFDDAHAARLSRRGVLVAMYAGLDGLRAEIGSVSRFMPSASVQVLVAPGQEAEVTEIAQATNAGVRLPQVDGAWRSWAHTLWADMCAAIDVQIPMGSSEADADSAAREFADQAIEQTHAGTATPGRDEERRRQQQDENARIQEDDGAMIPSRLELDEMLERCVWLAEGEVVAYVTPNRSQFLTYKEFRSLTAESVTFVDVGEEGEEAKAAKPVLTAKLWQSDTRRKGAMTRTFKAGADVICADPEGDRAVNLWRPIIRRPATTAIDLFLDHVEYLFENEAERQTFLDWCAHLEQRPGELPHYGWLHIASHTGCGRNWLASVLARVWRGYVAPNVDLPALLDSQYNGSIARRVLAIVDEIQEGGSGNRRHTNRLTALLNAETRLINPKFGRQFQEFNSCRWLVFSNHLNALPIDNTDRRWRVVTHEKAPRPAGDYERLYAALADKEFINAVGVFFRERDIIGFKPGERPPLNAAKAAAIAASKPIQTTLAEDIRDHWPADIILNDHVAEILADQPDADYTPAMRRAMEEIGAVAIADQLKINGRAQRGWILRNTESWRGASKGTQRQEINRAGVGRMISASAVFADAMDYEP